jgi:hypothetical protein
MASGTKNVVVHVGPKGGLFVYKNGRSGAKRYLRDSEKSSVATETAVVRTTDSGPSVSRHTSLHPPVSRVTTVPPIRRHFEYGVLPKPLPDALALLVAEFLEGDVRRDDGGAPTPEQLELEHLIALKCQLTDETCATLIRDPLVNDRTTLLCRSGCVCRYKAARAPIREYLLGPDFNIVGRYVEFLLDSHEWKLTEDVQLDIQASATASNQQRRFRLNLRAVGRNTNRDVLVWIASDERHYWQAIAEKHNMQAETGLSDPWRDHWNSPPLELEAAADIISAYLWSAERGTVYVLPEYVSDRPRAELMIAQVNPGLHCVE